MPPDPSQHGGRGGRWLDRHALIAIAFCTFIALIVTGPALVGRSSLAPDQILDWDPLYRTGPEPALPFARDYTPSVLDFPRDLYFARGLHAGRLDSWNPLSGCGAPLWAEQAGPFSPLKLPFYASPSRATYFMFLALRLVVAGLGAYFLGRRRGLAHVPALAAGATFELSGTLIAALPFAAGSAMYLLPWLILGSYAIADRPSLATVGGSAIAVGMVASSGHPTLILMVLLAFAVSLLGHMARAWRQPRGALTIALCATVATLLGLALAAPSLLPFAELWREGSTYKERGIGAVMWRLNFNVSRASLHTALFVSDPLRRLAGTRDVLELSSSIGILALVVALVGLLRRRLDLPLAAVMVLGAALAVAPFGMTWIQTPYLPLRHILPTYAWPLVILPLSQLTGDGVGVLDGAQGWRWGVPAVALYLGAALAILIGLSPETGPIASLKQALAGNAPVTALLVPPVLTLSAFGICFALQRTAVARFTAIGLLLTLIAEQLTIVLPYVQQPISAVLNGATSGPVQFLRNHLRSEDGRLIALPGRLGYPLSTMLFGLADARGVSALPIRRYFDYLQAISPAAALLTVQDIPVTQSPLLDLAAVRFIAVPTDAAVNESPAVATVMTPAQRPADDDSATPLRYRDAAILIYENRAAQPRVRIVHRSDVVADEATARQRLTQIAKGSPDASRVDLAQRVVLEPAVNGHAPPSLAGAQPAGERAQIVDQADPDRLVIEATLHEPGFLIIADTYYPGWRATIDGEPTPIFPANLLFRAVFVPPGTHTIVLRYAPTSLRSAVVVFALAALVCACCLAPGVRQRVKVRWQ